MGEDKLLVNIEETHKFIEKNCFSTKKIGFLGTYKTSLLENYFAKMGRYELIYPNEDGKNNIYNAIYSLEYGIKALSNPITRKAKRLFKEEIDKFIKNGIKCIILGYTECYLAFIGEQYYKNVQFIDINNDIVKSYKNI